MSKDVYKQCRLEKTVGESKHIQVAYIPSQFAKVGKVICLRKANAVGAVHSFGGWDEGWTVMSAGAARNIDEITIQRRAQRAFAGVLADH